MFLTGSLTFTPRMCAHYDERPLDGSTFVGVFYAEGPWSQQEAHISVSCEWLKPA